MALRVTAWAPRAQQVSWSDVGRDVALTSAAASTDTGAHRRAYFGDDLGWVDAELVTRFDLIGEPIRGPIIVEEATTTVVVPPDWDARSDEHGNIVLRRASRAGGG
jgi:N-methylhydantoinase A/oxoprolinase/acetone carboxylase beta subunit